MITQLSSDNVTRFAERIGHKQNTVLGYLKPEGQGKIKISTLYDILDNFPEINPTWLFTGEGEMFGDQGQTKIPSLPPEELDEKLTPTQREMLTYKRLQTELGRSPERIADGIDAIVMGKCVSEKKQGYGVGEDRGLRTEAPNKVQEDGAKFGDGI
ncbi:MAG: XRE family transcriptional regulator [Desulfovibrio sp.]